MPPTGRYLLDTNIVIALFADEATVKARLATAAEVFVPAVVLGELYVGARKSGQPAANLAKVEQFAAATAVLPSDAATARHYGEVKDGPRLKGRPIPENDVWIAAVVLQHGRTLVSCDAHFGDVDGLQVEVW